jgi:hypothetical protein
MNEIEMTHEDAMREVFRLREREAHFIRALAVADGGRFRNDFDGAIALLVRDRNDAVAIADAHVRGATLPIEGSYRARRTLMDALDEHYCWDATGDPIDEAVNAVVDAMRTTVLQLLCEENGAKPSPGAGTASRG